MNTASIRVGNMICRKGVGSKIKTIPGNQRVTFHTSEFSYALKPFWGLNPIRNDQCCKTGSTFSKSKWRWNNIHLSVSYHYVSI